MLAVESEDTEYFLPIWNLSMNTIVDKLHKINLFNRVPDVSNMEDFYVWEINKP